MDVNELLVVVQCFSSECRVCWAIAPAVETLAHENPEVCFLRVDVLALPAVAAKLQERLHRQKLQQKRQQKQQTEQQRRLVEGGGGGGVGVEADVAGSGIALSTPTFHFIKRGRQVGAFQGADEGLLRQGIESEGKVGPAICNQSCCVQ